MNVAVEGRLDAIIARRLLQDKGHSVFDVHIKHGKPNLLAKLSGYNAAARFAPYFVLVDLDHDHQCAPELLGEVLPNPAPDLIIRVAVREIESWLLADRPRIADFLSVSEARIPTDPDGLHDPKQALVNVARRSRRREIREGIVPTPTGRRSEGPLYASLLTSFVLDTAQGWRPSVAARYSDSLSRALATI